MNPSSHHRSQATQNAHGGPTTSKTLIGGAFATLANPLILVVLALVLFGTGLLKSSEGGHSTPPFNGFTFVLAGTILFFIPEAVWGLIFGANFARFGQGGRLPGAIWGAAFWFLPAVTIMLIVMFTVGWQEWSEIHWWWQQPNRWSYYYVLPLAILVKEVSIGLTVGYVLGASAERTVA
jgi:hypothetical protein